MYSHGQKLNQSSSSSSKNQGEDDLLMEFVIGPDDSGKKILKTPLRVNIEDLARPGGVQFTAVDAEGNQRQTTMVVDEPQSQQQQQQQNMSRNAAESNAIRASQNDPANAQALGYIKREQQLDAVEGRKSHFVSSEFPTGVHGLSSSQSLSQSQSHQGHPGHHGHHHHHHSNKEPPRADNLSCCAANNKRCFGPPPLRRFAFTGYTNAVVGGDGLRRLIVSGGLSKVSVEHEIYEYSLSGQRWRRLECKAEQYTPAGMPIVPYARHSHSASVLLEAGSGGEPYLLIYGGVGLGGRVVPADALDTHQSRASFEELFGCDPESFSRQARVEEPPLQLCSVLDIIGGEQQQQQQQNITQGSGGDMSQNQSGAGANSNASSSMGGGMRVPNQVGVLDEIFELNMKNRQWRRVQVSGAAPPHLCEHTSVMFGNRMIVFGGTSLEMMPADGKFLHIMEAHRAPRSSASSIRSRQYSWSTRVLEPGPLGRSRHTAVASSPTTMAVFGGINAAGEILDDLWILQNATSEEPNWINVNLSGGGGSKSPAEGTDNIFAASASGTHVSDSGGSGGIVGRFGHSACMSHGHRLLIIGGNTDRGVISTISEINLGPILSENNNNKKMNQQNQQNQQGENQQQQEQQQEYEAVVRTVKIGGDSIPRFSHGCAISAGDGVSGMVFGGQKVWKEDKKKLMMIKNPTPEDIAKSRRRAREYETLSNGVYVFTFQELNRKEQRRLALEASQAAGDDEELSEDALALINEDTDSDRASEVPESFLKCVDRMSRGYVYSWEKVKKEQRKIADDAKVYSATRIFIDSEKANELVDLLQSARDIILSIHGNDPHGGENHGIPTSVPDRTERLGALEQLQQGTQHAQNCAGLKKDSEEKQQLNYIGIEQNLREAKTGWSKTKKLQDLWSESCPPHMKEWFDEHNKYLESAQESIDNLITTIRDIKTEVVDSLTKRLQTAEKRSRKLHSDQVKKVEHDEQEMMSKTAMQFVLEERRAAMSHAAQFAERQKQSREKRRAQSPRSTAGAGEEKSDSEGDSDFDSSSSDDGENGDGENGSPRTRRSHSKKRIPKKWNTKRMKSYPTPHYGDQVPDLEIEVIEIDRKTHGRLVATAEREVEILLEYLDKANSVGGDVAQKAYEDVRTEINIYAGLIDQIRGDLPGNASSKKSGGVPPPPPPPPQSQEQQNANSSAVSSVSSSSTTNTSASNSKANKNDKNDNNADQQQLLKSLEIIRHSKDLVTSSEIISAKTKEASNVERDGVKLVKRIKECVDYLDVIARNFRQYWHLTFLSRGYERGGNAAAINAAANNNARVTSSSSNNRKSSVPRVPSAAAARSTSSSNNNNRRPPSPRSGTFGMRHSSTQEVRPVVAGTNAGGGRRVPSSSSYNRSSTSKVASTSAAGGGGGSRAPTPNTNKPPIANKTYPVQIRALPSPTTDNDNQQQHQQQGSYQRPPIASQTAQDVNWDNNASSSNVDSGIPPPPPQQNQTGIQEFGNPTSGNDNNAAAESGSWSIVSAGGNTNNNANISTTNANIQSSAANVSGDAHMNWIQPTVTNSSIAPPQQEQQQSRPPLQVQNSTQQNTHHHSSASSTTSTTTTNSTTNSGNKRRPSTDDTLFKNKQKLTPGELRILEARARLK